MNSIWNELSEESKKYIKNRYDAYINECNSDVVSIYNCLFGEENLNPKPQIKTWEDVEKHYPMYRKLSPFTDLICSDVLYNKLVTTYKIHLLIELGYGGMVTNEEWEKDTQKHIIDCSFSHKHKK